jgi:hypothetical protein
MSEPIQRMILLFAAAMVVMIALLLTLQIGLGQLTVDEPHMVNPQSLAFSLLIAAAVTYLFSNHE